MTKKCFAVFKTEVVRGIINLFHEEVLVDIFLTESEAYDFLDNFPAREIIEEKYRVEPIFLGGILEDYLDSRRRNENEEI